jgi:hypothetical protein
MPHMSGTRSGSGPDDRKTVTWANETVPLAVRKEMLARELNKLGLRRATAQGGDVREGGNAQQQSHDESSHPQADEGDDARHGD